MSVYLQSQHKNLLLLELTKRINNDYANPTKHRKSQIQNIRQPKSLRKCNQSKLSMQAYYEQRSNNVSLEIRGLWKYLLFYKSEGKPMRKDKWKREKAIQNDLLQVLMLLLKLLIQWIAVSKRKERKKRMLVKNKTNIQTNMKNYLWSNIDRNERRSNCPPTRLSSSQKITYQKKKNMNGINKKKTNRNKKPSVVADNVFFRVKLCQWLLFKTILCLNIVMNANATTKIKIIKIINNNKCCFRK